MFILADDIDFSVIQHFTGYAWVCIRILNTCADGLGNDGEVQNSGGVTEIIRPILRLQRHTPPSASQS